MHSAFIVGKAEGSNDRLLYSDIKQLKLYLIAYKKKQFKTHVNI